MCRARGIRSGQVRRSARSDAPTSTEDADVPATDPTGAADTTPPAAAGPPDHGQQPGRPLATTGGPAGGIALLGGALLRGGAALHRLARHPG
ncbi:hypothetical protein [Saccharopolyspora griseoalba]|uniref:Uncharacterized protein n=1 Tax=Saccharopolyspora griseoalba TaxID=1431848 RepID=A0ABW2LNS2_9PSEU